MMLWFCRYQGIIMQFSGLSEWSNSKNPTSKSLWPCLHVVLRLVDPVISGQPKHSAAVYTGYTSYDHFMTGFQG